MTPAATRQKQQKQDDAEALPRWDLSALYSEPEAPELTRDLETAEREAKDFRARHVTFRRVQDQIAVQQDIEIDGAAGEGFTNTGAALVMSPALLTKYLDGAVIEVELLVERHPEYEAGRQLEALLDRGGGE